MITEVNITRRGKVAPYIRRKKPIDCSKYKKATELALQFALRIERICKVTPNCDLKKGMREIDSAVLDFNRKIDEIFIPKKRS